MYNIGLKCEASYFFLYALCTKKGSMIRKSSSKQPTGSGLDSLKQGDR